MTSGTGQLKTPDDAGKGDQGVVNRWMLEIDLAGKTEREWREKAAKALERYRDEKKRADFKFNILWSNTEVLRPHLYSSTPKANVRRRFSDPDPVGKVAAEVMERALDYTIETCGFDAFMNLAVLDYVLPGRSVARVRFEPSLKTNEEGQPEELEYARCYPERVPYEKFRRGPGISWNEVPWLAYAHDLTMDEVKAKFPGWEEKVRYDVTMDGVDQKDADKNPSVYKRVRIWEILDRQKLETVFVAPSHKDAPLKREPNKMNLEGFYDCPEPLYAIESGDSLVPQVEFEMYRDQARELDRVTLRINRIVTTLKQRGIYDSTIEEMKSVLTAADNEMIPTTSAMAKVAGIDKAIWMMPIDQAAGVLKILIEHREQVKQTIYEIMGIGDILRGTSDPNETLGAQQLKAQTGSLRMQRRQRDVQRFIREILRKMAEIIAENYTPELLSMMTNIRLLPDIATKEKAAAGLQQQAMLMKQAGQEPPQPPPELGKPTWEEVMKLLRSDLLRGFRIDIETDSTIAADEATQRQQVTELITGIGGFVQNMVPAVQSGVFTPEAAKTILIAAVRPFKMGRAVEDALEQEMERPPAPQPDPEAAKQAAAVQLEEKRSQLQAQNDQAKLQGEMQLEDKKLTNNIQLEREKAAIQAGIKQTEAAARTGESAVSEAAQTHRELAVGEQKQQGEMNKLYAQHEMNVERDAINNDAKANMQRSKDLS